MKEKITMENCLGIVNHIGKSMAVHCMNFGQEISVSFLTAMEAKKAVKNLKIAGYSVRQNTVCKKLINIEG